MKPEIKKLLLVALAYLFLEVASSPMRGFSFILCSSVMFPVYFLLTALLCKRLAPTRPWKILAAATAAILLPYLLTSKELLQIGHLDVLIHLLGVLGGCLFFKARPAVRCLVAALSAAFVFTFTPLWYSWISYQNYGSFRATTDVRLAHPLVLTCPTDTLVIGMRPGKTYVLDLWNSYCGYCMKGFPDFQALADKYQDSGRILFYTVNILEPRENPSVFDIPARFGCRLPVFACKDDEFLSSLGIQGVPVVLVITPDGRVAYRGPLERAEPHIRRLSHATL